MFVKILLGDCGIDLRKTRGTTKIRISQKYTPKKMKSSNGSRVSVPSPAKICFFVLHLRLLTLSVLIDSRQLSSLNQQPLEREEIMITYQKGVIAALFLFSLAPRSLFAFSSSPHRISRRTFSQTTTTTSLPSETLDTASTENSSMDLSLKAFAKTPRSAIYNR
jgi:hypothetical protein